jgi:uncharacterized damage-inducible protein DinB
MKTLDVYTFAQALTEDDDMEALADRAMFVQSEVERLAEYLCTLPPDAWIQPSLCEGWEVRDVVAHLTRVAEFYVNTISRGLKGDATAPPEFHPYALS